MTRMHEERMNLLERIEESQIEADELIEELEDATSMMEFSQLMESDLIQQSPDSLELGSKGQSLLLEHRLHEATKSVSESTEQLQEIMEEFKESSSNQNQKMLSKSKTMNRLTWAVLIATIVNVMLATFQVIN